MKIIILPIFVVLLALNSHAADILTLNNQLTFEGKVIKIKNCEVIFKAGGEKYIVPAADIYSIQFESIADKCYVEYVKMSEIDPELCAKGYNDAAMFHGKGFSHFALGFLFGPFAMIGTAIARPDPYTGTRTYMLSNNREAFTDPVYLKCYRKKAKAGNLAMEGLGWGTWMFLVLIMGNS